MWILVRKLFDKFCNAYILCTVNMITSCVTQHEVTCAFHLTSLHNMSSFPTRWCLRWRSLWTRTWERRLWRVQRPTWRLSIRTCPRRCPSSSCWVRGRTRWGPSSASLQTCSSQRSEWFNPASSAWLLNANRACRFVLTSIETKTNTTIIHTSYMAGTIQAW